MESLWHKLAKVEGNRRATARDIHGQRGGSLKQGSNCPSFGTILAVE